MEKEINRDNVKRKVIAKLLIVCFAWAGAAVIIFYITHGLLSLFGLDKIWHAVMFYAVCSLTFLAIYVKNKGNG